MFEKGMTIWLHRARAIEVVEHDPVITSQTNQYAHYPSVCALCSEKIAAEHLDTRY
jgi:hypothetical protein